MTMKRIARHFAAELEQAGLCGLPFSWRDDGRIKFSEAMTEAQKTAVLAVYEAHDPDTPPPAEP